MMDSVTVKAWREQVRRLQTGSGDPRLTKAVDTILDAAFPAIVEAKPTLDEWFALLDFIASAGPVQMKGVGWLLGLTQIVEELNSPFGPEATDQCVEGPFYRPHSKQIENGAPLYDVDDDGADIFFEGRVLDTAGLPLAGVEIDVWGTNGAGMYSHFDPSQPEHNCRGKLRSRQNGTYCIRTKFPQPYAIAGDVMGCVVENLGHQPWRPAHLHFKLNHPGFEPLITQICFNGQPYIDVDAALAVKAHLAADLAHETSQAALKARGMTRPFYAAQFDFKLQPLAGR